MPPTVSVAAFVFGMVLLLAAIVGKELKIAAIEVPALSRGMRLLAAIMGVGLLYIGLFDPIKPASQNAIPPVTATATPAVPAITAEPPPASTVVSPTPTNTTEPLPPTAVPAFVAFSNLRVSYDVTDPATQQYGMDVLAAFTITGYRGKPCRAVATFYDSEMKPLKDTNGQYTTGMSEVGVTADLIPGFDPANYSGENELRLFIPYRELHLAQGTHGLFVSMSIYEMPSLRLIGKSGSTSFKVIQN